MKKIALIVSAIISIWTVIPSSAQEKGFRLFDEKHMATICVDTSDFEVVDIAAHLLASDIEAVSGRRPQISPVLPRGRKELVIAGTLGCSPMIDRLVQEEQLDVSDIHGKWETYKIIRPDKNSRMKNTVIIIGSDRRATAYGLLTLSDQMDISPWIWWADVRPQERSRFFLDLPASSVDGPDVKFRGFFINDERYGLHAWAKHTFDRQLMDIGPKTYEKVFELMLRLRANYCWPAMHDCTMPFNEYEQNRVIADRYAIVMGSSHCEQMLRNNTREWHSEVMGPWNYRTNRANMLRYWNERLETNGAYDNIYTLGLRGLVDTEMYGANSTEARVKVTENVIADQRKILTDHIDRPIQDIPQLLCLYKEVQEVYEAGLEVPDDITLMWVDDNHGYIRRLPDAHERQRSGGAGMYYHLSYHGDPESWLWLSPISPSLINYEMGRAYDAGVQSIWMANVGDIKPQEKELSFFMEMAWDRERWTLDNVSEYNATWAGRYFGEALSAPVGKVLDRYYALAASGKPEHVKYVNFSLEEMEARCLEALSLIHEVEDLEPLVPERLQSAFFQLVEYPAKGAALMNLYYLKARISCWCAQKDMREKALFYSEESAEAERELDLLTDCYHALEGGKWNKMMTWRNWRELDRDFHWPRADVALIQKCFRAPAPILLDGLDWKGQADTTIRFNSVSSGKACVWLRTEGKFMGWTTYNVRKADGGDDFVGFYDDRICDLVLDGEAGSAHLQPIGNAWHATSVGPLWNRVGDFDIRKGENVLELQHLQEGTEVQAVYIGEVPPMASPYRTHVTPAAYTDLDGRLRLVPGLASEGAVVGAPVKEGTEVNALPAATYTVPVPAGSRRLEIRTLPTHAVAAGKSLGLYVSVDGQDPVFMEIEALEFTSEWQNNVLRGYAVGSMELDAGTTGDVQVRVFFPDQHVAFMGIFVY